MKSKYAPVVYAALRDAGMNNREIAAHLGVSEAAVRRGLKSAPARDADAELGRAVRAIGELLWPGAPRLV